jgi:hypothetical protein
MHPTIKKICMVAYISCIATTATAFEIRLGSKFLDYGNGAINLDNVMHINPTIDYIITLEEDDKEDYFRNYVTSNPRDLEKVKSWFFTAINVYPYYYYEVYSDIKFDLFTLTILSTKRFAKLPRTPEEFEKIVDLDKFNHFLTKLENHLTTNGLIPYNGYNNQITDLEERYWQVYSLLNDVAPQLSESGIKEVFSGLEDTAIVYNQVVK